MVIVYTHEAKTHLSRPLGQSGRVTLRDRQGGRPVAKVVAVEAPEPGEARRLGFPAGEIEVPDDLDRMGKP